MKTIYLILFSLVLQLSSAQKNEKIISTDSLEKEMANIEKELYIDTQQSIIKLKKIYKDSQSINYSNGLLMSIKNLIILYISNGEERKALEYCDLLERVAKKHNDYDHLSKSHQQKGVIYTNLGLYKEAKKQFSQATLTIKQDNNNNRRHFQLSSIYQSMLNYYESTNTPQDTILNYLKKSIHEVNQIVNDQDDIYLDHKYDMLSYLNMNLGMFYTGLHKPQRLDIAEHHLLESLHILENHKFTKIDANDIPIINSLGRFYIEKNDFQNALEHAYKVLDKEKKRKSPYDRMIAFATITNAYEGLEKKDSILKYMSLYSNLSDSINHEKKKLRANTFEIINTTKEKNQNKKLTHLTLIIIAIVLLLIIIGYLLYRKKQIKLHKNYQIILKNTKVENQQNIISEKSITISDETIHVLLSKLKKFEDSKKYLRQDMNLTYLANSLHTNTRYLSEIINQHKGKNFYNYLNHLRIQYITELLLNEPKYREYKISYLAEISGFTSREVFSTIFKKETGVTPSYFINNLKKDL